jgi:serine/threonine protein kinase
MSGRIVTFNVPDSSSSSENEVKESLDDIDEVIRRPNIVDFEHVPADSHDAAADMPEDPDHEFDPIPDNIPHFGDILTLEEIISHNKKLPGSPTSKLPAGLPEPRVWHVLLSVLKVPSYLHTGRKLPIIEHSAPHDWRPIVHNAIRPQNIIFLHPISRSSSNLHFGYGRCMGRPAGENTFEIFASSNLEFCSWGFQPQHSTQSARTLRN